MAEIGLIASVIQVAGAGLKLSQTLYQYAETVASADRRIKDIAKEVQLTSFVIDELGHVFKQDQTSALLSKNALKTADETVRECSSVFTELDAALKKTKKNPLGKLMLPFRESKIDLLRSHIDKLKSTLQLLMQVLTHAHQIASQKLDREAEAAQREHIKNLLQNKKESTKRYEESLKNYESSDDEDQEVKENQGPDEGESTTAMMMAASSISSTITTKSLETCVQHIRSLLDDIETLQLALSDEAPGNDSSEHQQSLLGSYFRARGHLDSVLLGNPSSGDNGSINSTEQSFAMHKTLTGSTLLTTSTQSSQEIMKQSVVEETLQVGMTWSSESELKAAFREAILKAQENARVEERQTITQQARQDAEKRMEMEEAARSAKLEAEEAVARAKMEHDAAKKAASEILAAAKKAKEEAEAKAMNDSYEKLAKKEKHVIFKDAMGRKFSFPFHLCKTWEGMQDLINAAVMRISTNNVKKRILKDEYDLFGPEGEIIMPKYWDALIEPGFTITMHMWNDSEPEAAPRPPRPPPPLPMAPVIEIMDGAPPPPPVGIPMGPRPEMHAPQRRAKERPSPFMNWSAGGSTPSQSLKRVKKSDPTTTVVKQHGSELSVVIQPVDEIINALKSWGIPKDANTATVVAAAHKHNNLEGNKEDYALSIEYVDPQCLDPKLIIPKDDDQPLDFLLDLTSEGRAWVRFTFAHREKEISIESHTKTRPGVEKNEDIAARPISPASSPINTKRFPPAPYVEDAPTDDSERNSSPKDRIPLSAASDPGDFYEGERKSFRRKSKRDSDGNISSPARYDEQRSSKKDKEKRSSGQFEIFSESEESLVDTSSKSSKAETILAGVPEKDEASVRADKGNIGPVERQANIQKDEVKAILDQGPIYIHEFPSKMSSWGLSHLSTTSDVTAAYEKEIGLPYRKYMVSLSILRLKDTTQTERESFFLRRREKPLLLFEKLREQGFDPQVVITIAENKRAEGSMLVQHSSNSARPEISASEAEHQDRFITDLDRQRNIEHKKENEDSSLLSQVDEVTDMLQKLKKKKKGLSPLSAMFFDARHIRRDSNRRKLNGVEKELQFIRQVMKINSLNHISYDDFESRRAQLEAQAALLQNSSYSSQNEETNNATSEPQHSTLGFMIPAQYGSLEHYGSPPSLDSSSYPPPPVYPPISLAPPNAGSVTGLPSSPSNQGNDPMLRVTSARPKPQCWEHGCNGRQFPTFSNLLRHHREKSGTPSYPPTRQHHYLDSRTSQSPSASSTTYVPSHASSSSVQSQSQPRRSDEHTIPPPHQQPMGPLSVLDISYPTSDQRSQRSDPAPASSYDPSPSPTYAQQQDPYIRGSAVIQPAQSTRRRSSSTTSTRPASYHGGDPLQGYWVPGMPATYPSPPQEHGPPPAMSAYQNISHRPQMARDPYAMMGATPSNFYPPRHPMQTPLPYDGQRPPMPSRNSSNFNTRRPISGYGPAPITQDHSSAPGYSGRPANAPQSARQDRSPLSQFDSESSEYESSGEDYDRALMPPPKLKSSERRPSLRHANTTQVYNADRRMSQSLTLEPPRGRDQGRDTRASMIRSAVPPRPTSRSRPALIQQPKAQSYETSRGSRIMVENSKSRRRQSYQSYNVDSRRQSKIYLEEGIQLPERRRARTNANNHPHETKLKDTTNDVEAYLQRTRGSDAPLNDQIHRAAKRASRVPSRPSENGSSRSEGSDKQSRASQSNRTAVTSGSGEIRLRVDASAPLSLPFNGDMEGRTLQINPAEDGMAEIVIGNPRGNENTYRSEKGSVLGKKYSAANQARREAEESSVRSGRSRQGRRDEQRRVLRRRGETGESGIPLSTGPSASSSGVATPTSSVSTRFNVHANEFKPSPAASTFLPSANPSTSSAPEPDEVDELLKEWTTVLG